MDLKQLREDRGVLIKQSHDLLETAEAEGRGLNEEERSNYDKIFDDQEKLKKRIVDGERQEELDREAATKVKPDTEQTRIKPGTGTETTIVDGGDAVMEGFRSYLVTGRMPEPDAIGGAELRALQADSDEAGGYLIPPPMFVANLIKAVDDMVFVRTKATIHPVTGSAGMGQPSLDADPADADWTTELATGSEDSTMDFGGRLMEAHPLAKRIKISQKFLRLSAIPAETLVKDRLAYKFGITMEKGYFTGHGAAQPLGVFTASSLGISTGRDISTDNSTTEITYDNLKEVKFTLKSQYWPRANWCFHRDAVKMISKLKDGEGRYLWEASVQAGEPDKILQFPYWMSEYAPNTFTTGLYVGILGDFSFYHIMDSLNFQLQRLVELYAETNQIGFIGRYEGDGMPVLEEAFVRVTLA